MIQGYDEFEGIKDIGPFYLNFYKAHIKVDKTAI